MTSKDRGFRMPLSPEEQLNGAAYYTPNEIDRIIKTFKPREGFNRTAFASELEIRANFQLVQVAFYLDPAPTPSETERELRELANLLRDADSALSALHYRVRAYLNFAAMKIAERDGCLPNLGPGRVVDPPGATRIMRFSGELEIVSQGIPWLTRVVVEAVQLVGRAKGGSSLRGRMRRSAPTDALFWSLARLWEKSSSEPIRANKDRVTNEIKGNLIDFLETCSRPLGYTGTRRAIYDAYYRAKKASKAGLL